MIFDWDAHETMFKATFEVKHARDGEVWIEIEGRNQIVTVQENQTVSLEWEKPKYRFWGKP